tara:strand:+ start:2365 stop:2664 length:300 start_codon:yes stop_codon:yes gene_type:complete
MGKRFVCDKDRFIGGVLRREGVPFSLDEKHIPKKLPDGMRAADTGEELTPQQKAAETRRLNKEKAEREAAEIEKKSGGNENKAPDFMDAEPSEGKVTTV